MEAVYTGKDGLLSGNVRGKLLIEMSTVRGDDHRALAPEVAAKGAALIECPVSGSGQTGPRRNAGRVRRGHTRGIHGRAAAARAAHAEELS